MSLFLITVKSRLAANLTVMEKGMTVEVSYRNSELYDNVCSRKGIGFQIKNKLY